MEAAIVAGWKDGIGEVGVVAYCCDLSSADAGNGGAFEKFGELPALNCCFVVFGYEGGCC